MQEKAMNLITSGTKIEGTLEVNDTTRFEGVLSGTLRGLKGSEIIIGEGGIIEGRIECESIIIDGFVRGDIIATAKVKISGSGKVIGQVKAPSFSVEFGGYFYGDSSMGDLIPEATPTKESPAGRESRT